MTQQTAELMQKTLNDVKEMTKDNKNCIFLKRMADNLKRFNYLLSMMTYGRVITDIKEMEAERKREAETFRKVLLEELGKTEPKIRDKIVRRIHEFQSRIVFREDENDG